ncbi:Uncharacterized protein involved in exopolysaccharide biosynthesis [Bryocella elongata]|uniref:Uncharacterized protein involved in exopolysaccharide biosynthesis n=1 Tax=Bryocella elongata TaxID=863522 RepID=A0A1H6AUX7_9BACT|nr:Uncharacterized protein involved in exopolysaccharide biosynthesis [Bryocella elongata]
MGGAATRSAAPPAFRLDVVRSVRQHVPLALSVGTIVFALVVIFALSRKPMYQAESMTYVEPLVTRSVDDGTPGVYDPSRYDSYLQQQMQTATRPDILEQAIATLPAGTWQLPGEDIHSAAARLAASLKVQRVAQSYQLSISLSSPNPRQAADVVNAATNIFLQQGRHDETVRQDGRLQLLKEEHARIQAELDADQKEQTQLGQQLGVADPAGSFGNPFDSQLANIRSELVSARQAHDIAAAQLATIASAKDPDGAKAVADDAIASDATVTALKQTITQRRALLASQMAALTPANPVYKQDQQEIAQLDKQLDGRVTQLRDVAERKLEDKLRLDLERTGDVEARLNGQLAQQTALAHTAAPRLQRATELAADITRLENRYTTVEEAIRSLSLDTNGPGTTHLVVAASVPSKPEPSKQRLLFALALPLGLLAGIAAAVFARKRDPRLYTEGDVEEQIGFLPMVSMPALEEVSSVAAEEYLLRMAAALERAYRVGKARTFVFTAATPTTDISGFVHALRLKLIGLGFKTQAVSADEALLGQNVGVQPAAVRPGLQDGLATASLDRLKSSYDMILLEARPLMHSAEAEYAVRTADATILVVESAFTTNEEIRECALLLQRLKADGIGVALLGLHRNVVGAEMRASIAEAERRRPARAIPTATAEPKVLEDRVYDMMERRARQERVVSAREDAGKLGIVEPKRAPDEDQAPYEDRISSFQHEEQDGTPYVECVTAARPNVTPATISRPVSSASTREVPMRDKMDDLRKSLAQVEFTDNNIADDLPDGSPAVGRSFFRFFERNPEEESPAVIGSEIERAFDRVLKRPEPQPRRSNSSQEFGRTAAEPTPQLPSRYIPAEPAPPVIPERHPLMQDLVPAEPMQPAWSFAPENHAPDRESNSYDASSYDSAGYDSGNHSAEGYMSESYAAAPSSHQPDFDTLRELRMPWGQSEPEAIEPEVSPLSEARMPWTYSSSSYAPQSHTSDDALHPVAEEPMQHAVSKAATGPTPPAPSSDRRALYPVYVPSENVIAARMPQPPATALDPAPAHFPDPELTPFAREQHRREVARAAEPLPVALVDPRLDSGTFRHVAPAEMTTDHLRSELIPAHATAVDPAGSMYVLRDELSSPLASARVAPEMRVAEPIAISSARSAAAVAAQRLAAKMAAELPAAPPTPSFPRREHISGHHAAFAAEAVTPVVASPIAATPVSSASAVEAPDEDMPGWLSSAEAERIRQLLARFSDGVARSQVEEPAATWFAQPRSAESQPEPVPALASGPLYAASAFQPIQAPEPKSASDLRPVASVATARPTDAEIHFGYSHAQPSVPAVEVTSSAWGAPSAAAASFVEPVIAEPAVPSFSAYTPSVSIEAPQVSASAPVSWSVPDAIHAPDFGVPAELKAYEIPASTLPAASMPVPEFASAAHFEQPAAALDAEPEGEVVPELQWPSWPTLARNATLLPSDHQEAESRPWYETFENHFREASQNESLVVAESVPHVAVEPAPIADADAEPAPKPVSYAPVAPTHAEPAQAAPTPAPGLALQVEAPTESMAAPVVIRVAEAAPQPVIEAVNNSQTHAVLPTNPISTLYSSHAPSAVSRASAEAVLARTLAQAPVRSFEESGPLYFHESHPATPMPRADAGETLRFNGNGHAPSNGNGTSTNGNGNGHASNGNGHPVNGYQRLVESSRYELQAAEVEFEAPTPWKTRKPPVSAPAQVDELTPQPGRWGMLSRFDPHSTSADVLGPAGARFAEDRDDSEEEPQRRSATR